MAICFDAIGEKYVTFLAAKSAQKGAVCKVSVNDTVGGCVEDDAFCGVVADVRDGCAAVVMSGYVEVACSSSTLPGPGYVMLAADGKGGVKKSSSAGRTYLVVHTDTAAGTLGLFL